MFSDHFEASALVAAPADSVFAYADDPARFSSHMSKSSWMMGGGRMLTELDAGRGEIVGSRIRLSGKVFGLELSVEGIVTERVPPQSKAWETTGSPRLVVIDHYRMGFEIAPQADGSLLRVYIDYALPQDLPARWLGVLLGRYYARWCTDQMVRDTAKHFASFDPKSSAQKPTLLMTIMNSRKHWRAWIWLCPLTMIGLAVAVLFVAGLTIWTAVLAAMLLGCPAIILWGAFHNRGARRLEANTTHEERDDHGS